MVSRTMHLVSPMRLCCRQVSSQRSAVDLCCASRSVGPLGQRTSISDDGIYCTNTKWTKDPSRLSVLKLLYDVHSSCGNLEALRSSDVAEEYDAVCKELAFLQPSCHALIVLDAIDFCFSSICSSSICRNTAM